MILDHKHLIVRAEVLNPPLSVNETKEWVKELIYNINMKLVTKLNENPIAFHCDMVGNQGITCVAIIETSHISIHTWTEVNPTLIQFDAYSCADFKPKQILDMFDKFNPVSLAYKFIDRNKGLQEVI